MENTAPFSSVWGSVTNVKVDPQASHDVIVTIAGQVIRFPSAEINSLRSLGLLRLTNKKVFLIVGENKVKGTNFILAGWKNPQTKVVFRLQPLVIEVETFDLMVAILPEKPDWKRWKGSFSSVVNHSMYWS
jgi:hypothetical protein